MHDLSNVKGITLQKILDVIFANVLAINHRRSILPLLDPHYQHIWIIHNNSRMLNNTVVLFKRWYFIIGRIDHTFVMFNICMFSGTCVVIMCTRRCRCCIWTSAKDCRRHICQCSRNKTKNVHFILTWSTLSTYLNYA